ncbi:oxidoreductase [Bacillus chungangensis]|uniref:NAD(P)-dependent dehydrogenase (Short-subunit alcohol dehydrogenase family) n=1 Tax=Bacillus chungangensis TaxID=587633 RepID=A0ABT9WRA8_9BACI|nr:oxidoreductase [Bacillus chungangensis]MDQ0175305.1 NAD(P)-dependent dehydrogenase (short-subunit alcohol dehydrogenase family) [Bacillus chungangensis]
MGKKTAIITGTSSGFGLLTAIELAKNGFYVIATMRDVSKAAKLEELAESHNVKDAIQVQPLDVTSSESIDQFQVFVNTLTSVDVLVNNAGFAMGGFGEEVAIEEYRRQFETNFFGTIAVTQTVLPSMRQQRSGKIIYLSSISGQIGFPGLSPYVSSKFALEGFSECLRLELKPLGIDVALVEPGSYKTNIWSSGKQIAKKSMLEDSPYYTYMKSFEQQIETEKARFGDPLEVAQLICSLAISDEIKKLRHPIGKGVKLGISLRKCIPWSRWEKLFFHRLGQKG